MNRTEPQRSQLDKFKEAARDLETDDDEARFDEMVRTLLDLDNPERQRKPMEKPE